MNTKRNHNGMTLLELIVAMSISVIVILMIISFISGAFRIFQKTNHDVNLQMEAQTAVNQLVNIFMEASYVSDKIDVIDDTSGDSERYRVVNPTEIGSDYAIIYKNADKELYLTEIGDSASLESVTFDKESNLLAEYVASFEITGDSNFKELQIDFRLGDDVFHIDRKVSLRNCATPTP